MDDLSPYIMTNQLYSDRYEFQLSPEFFNLFENRMLISAFSSSHLISSVSFHFFQSNGVPLRNQNNQPIQHFSERHDGVHFFNINHNHAQFSYARCLVNFEKNSKFDLHNLYFHCSRPNNHTLFGKKSVLNFVFTNQERHVNEVVHIFYRSPFAFDCWTNICYR